MSHASHIIKSATVDFQYSGNADGLALQNEVKEWVQELVQHLETQFDAIVPAGSFLSIDQLELEVDLSGDNWREKATIQVLKQWKEKLPHFQSTDRVEGKSLPTKKDRVGELFLFYLEQGHLPWQASSSDKQQWASLLEGWLKVPTRAWVTKLKEVLGSSKAAKDRFLTMVPLQLALSLFSSFAEERERAVIEDYRLLFKLAQKNETSVLKHAYFSFLSDVFTQQKGSYLSVLLTKEKTVTSPFKKGTFQSALFKQAQKELLLGQTAEQPFALDPFLESAKQAFQKPSTENAEYEEGIYISNAGLVIVASFLPTFFNRLGIRGKSESQSPDFAVCLVNYLATGKEEMQEFELALPKLLCGIPLETVIDPSLFLLSGEAKQETESLLSSVVEHWSILKNTSVEGLRESFLLREGKLVQKGDNWTLQVEQKAYDMLLQQLPWGIGMIKLPWMSGLLTTEWVY